MSVTGRDEIGEALSGTKKAEEVLETLTDNGHVPKSDLKRAFRNLKRERKRLARIQFEVDTR